MKDTITNVYIGVDVSKKFLDVHFLPLDKGIRIANTKQGVEKLIKKLSDLQIGQIVCEASGGYEYLMYSMLTDAKYDVWPVEPKRIKAFIYSEGQRAKTDKIDARMIALFASKMTRNYTPVHQTKAQYEIAALIKCKADLTAIAAQQKTKIQAPVMAQYCKEILMKNIEFTQLQIEELDKKIRSLVKQDKEIAQKVNLLSSMTGIGFSIASTLAVEVPELGVVNNKEIAAILGVAPYPKQSGAYVGRSTICAGRSMPRHLLYMGALSASQTDSCFGKFYKKLLAVGKRPKVALVALMRKMIVILNTLVRKGETWSPAIG